MRWQTAVIIGSAAIHAAAIAGVVVGAMWQVDKLDLTSNVDVTLRVPPPPGDSSPPPAAQKLAVQTEQVKPVKVVPKDLVQKTEVTDPEPPKDTGGGSTTNGQIGGTGTDPNATGTCLTGNCTGGGGDDTGDDEVVPECADGIDNDKDGKTDGRDPACASGKDTEDQDPTPVLPPNVGKGLRISGNEHIYPPEMVRVEMMHQGKNVVQATVQLCVSKAGSVDSVRLLKKTGFKAYDEVLAREIREWKYRPYLVDGRPSPMCTVAVIIYRMK